MRTAWIAWVSSRRENSAAPSCVIARSAACERCFDWGNRRAISRRGPWISSSFRSASWRQRRSRRFNMNSMPHSASFARVSSPTQSSRGDSRLDERGDSRLTLTPGVRAALVAVRAYQLLLAPFTGGACRFTPTCSAYALEALTEHGVWRGGRLALARVAKCQPLGPTGIDPVPPSSR